MIEILAGNMRPFFEKMFKDTEMRVLLGYEGTVKNLGKIEVWQLREEDLDILDRMSEAEFCELAGEDAWWRFAQGSNQGIPFGTFTINGKQIKGWLARGLFGYKARCNYDSLMDYFNLHMEVSQPRNICALAVDLAKYNNMTISELFTKLQPIEVNENV